MVFGFLVNFIRDIQYAYNVVVVLYSTSFLFCALFVYVGIAKFSRKQHLVKYVALLSTLTFLAVCYFSFVHDSVFARRAVVSFSCAIISIFSAAAITSKPGGKGFQISHFLKFIFTFNAVWLLAFSLLPLWDNSDIAILKRPVPAIATFLLLLATSSLWTYGLIILVSQKLSDQLSSSKLFLESTLDGLAANIALIDGSGEIVLVNQAWRNFASSNGASPEFVSEGVSYLGVCDNSCSECSYDAHLFSEGMKGVLSGAMETFTLEYACHSPTRQRWFLGRITPFPGGGPRMVVVAHEDITERKLMEIALEESNRKLELMTNEDALTKISNRRHFDTMLAYECNRHVRSGSTLSIMMLDIDFFKNFNDTYGHVKGDECLQAVAQTISQCLKRPADLAARYGGEEFVCLLPDTSLIGAVGVAENMRRAVVERAIPHSGSLASNVVTVSIGVLSIRCEPTTTPEQVVHQADELLYQAKREGRNRIKFKAAHEESYIQHTSSIGALKIVWNREYLSGNPYIDQQHMDLVGIVNNLLQDVLLCDAGIDVNGQIKDILLHVAQHFSDEEDILRAIGYPEADAHASEHNRLLQKCSDLLEKNAEAGVHSVDILQCIIHDLVLKHMFTEDAKYHSYSKGK